MHVVRMVDAINACKPINEFEIRKNDLKNSLRNIIRDRRKITFQLQNDGSSPYSNYCNNLLEAILSSTGEFRIAYVLREVDTSLEFTAVRDKRYPDFRFQDCRS
jgi:hypothetical protein